MRARRRWSSRRFPARLAHPVRAVQVLKARRTNAAAQKMGSGKDDVQFVRQSRYRPPQPKERIYLPHRIFQYAYGPLQTPTNGHIKRSLPIFTRPACRAYPQLSGMSPTHVPTAGAQHHTMPSHRGLSPAAKCPVPHPNRSLHRTMLRVKTAYKQSGGIRAALSTPARCIAHICMQGAALLCHPYL